MTRSISFSRRSSDLHDGERIHAEREMLAVILEHADRQDGRKVAAMASRSWWGSISS